MDTVQRTLSDAVQRTILPSGLRIVTEHMPGTRSAAVGLWIGTGSRDEHPSHAGAAHFLEHLLFKATPTRTAQDFAETMDAVGGELNAFTAREHTCFYAHVLDTDLELAIDLVTDVVLRGRCLSADVEIERGVVLDELAMRDDDADDMLGDAFLEAILPGHRLGRPIIGTVGSIEAMTRRQLKAFHQSRYRPEHMVLAVAGNIDHHDVVELLRRHAAEATEGERDPSPRRAGELVLREQPRLAVHERDTEQIHVALGMRSFGRHDPRRWALSVLDNVCGGGMSSRLFQEVRENRGLAYSVYSSTHTFADAGALGIYAGCHEDNLTEVIEVIEHVLVDLAVNGITAAECQRAKGNLRGQLVLGLEDVQARMNRIGRSEVSYGDQMPVEDTIARIEAVTLDEVNAVARELFQRPLGAALVGPYANSDAAPLRLRQLCGVAGSAGE
ncbi:M16 family metallopeptidase [Lolliginicoccus suaedae]|uniref:M16 family metallopeptidase n=1 Tax=Lolliginicoccus suaedae TaxID=2605429 RepID=UPI0022A688C8|nr:pitrilysin family protein [Lolliginicoccus suaedae]